MMRHLTAILIFMMIFCSGISAQTTDGFIVPARIVDGDTVPELILDEVTITPPYSGTVPKNPVKYSKLIRDVKKVYPYAVIAGVKLKEYNDMIAQTTDETEKKKKLKQAEEDLKQQFTDDIENMTLTQGKILLKLIYRQTGVSSYEIVKELRGSLRAIFWQTLARVFGANLKVDYDPTGDDKAIEDIVQQIENGSL
jgi:hypothetical protein